MKLLHSISLHEEAATDTLGVLSHTADLYYLRGDDECYPNQDSYENCNNFGCSSNIA